MKVCADTSFIVKLLVPELGSDEVTSLYRSLNRPRLPYTQIHQMEVEAALAQKAFIARSSGIKRTEIQREKEATLRRLEKWIQMALLIETAMDWSDCFDQTLKIIPLQSEKLGCRTMDMIHISIALKLQTDTFITCDERQAKAAKAQGLKTQLIRIQ